MRTSKSLFILLIISLVLFTSCTNTPQNPPESPNTGVNIQKIDLFPFQAQHVHGSTIVELPDGSLLAAWFQGSGERQADDVAIYGARYKIGEDSWSEAFLMADVPDFPDTNPVLFLDPQDQLWLMWYTVLANQWETSLLKYRISEDYMKAGAPNWKWQDMIHMKPGGSTERGIQEDDPFVTSMRRKFMEYYAYLDTTGAFKQGAGEENWQSLFDARVEELGELAEGKDLMARGTVVNENGETERKQLGYPRFRRLGWQTRNKPIFLEDGRMIVPLYSDGFDFSIMAITDNGGKNWHFSEPLVSIGGVQPAILQRKDGTIYTLMRDNGPPPQRLLTSESTDNGKTWTPVVDSNIPNSGTAAEMVKLQDGRWLLVNNDTEDGRHSLAIYVSKDEGKTWQIALHLEKDESQKSRAHYPAIIQGKDGSVHAIYSYHVEAEDGKQQKTIRYARLERL